MTLKSLLSGYLFLWGILSALNMSASPAELDSSLKIEAGLAFYQGNTLIFKDNVHLIHELGDISSGQIEIIPDPQDKKISKLALSKKVSIHLSRGGQLDCAKADIDLSTNTGVFEGDDSQPFVKYLESYVDKSKSSPVPVVLTSKKMKVEIAREKKEANSQMATYLSRIVAENEVTIDYNHDFIAQADFASFDKKNENVDVPSHAYPGIISMKSNRDEGVCHITNLNGDLIQAKHISIDIATKQIGCSYPRGVVAMNHSDDKNNGNGLDFKADTLIWKDLQQQLLLKDHVVRGTKRIPAAYK